MKNLRNKRSTAYYLFFILIISCFLLFLSQNNGFRDINLKKDNPNSTIDFNLINQLNESNKKSIDISSWMFNETEDFKTLQLLFKIKKEQEQIRIELKKLSEKNLILLLRGVSNLGLDIDPSTQKISCEITFSSLEREISKQIEIFSNIKKTTLNLDFQLFAERSLIKLNNNQKDLYANYAID